jgi:hypothetical protein
MDNRQELLTRAKAYQAKHPGVNLMAAINAVSRMKAHAENVVQPENDLPKGDKKGSGVYGSNLSYADYWNRFKRGMSPKGG